VDYSLLRRSMMPCSIRSSSPADGSIPLIRWHAEPYCGDIAPMPARCGVCTGAFALAAAGLLDGRRATTHWRYVARLQREYPSIRVEAGFASSVGRQWYGLRRASRPGSISRWLLIEEDHGFAIAKGVAQHLVVYHRAMADNRNSQLPSIWRQRMTGLPLPLAMLAIHIAEGFTVERLAEEIGMSLRQFSRAFGRRRHHAAVWWNGSASVWPEPHRDDCRTCRRIAEAVRLR